MCRWMAWIGQPVLIEELLFNTQHGIVDQSLHARMGAEPTNGDGFGLGWYGGGEGPAVYHSVAPAWGADNLRELLLASPLGQKVTLGIDPGFRTGCKVVLLDRQGKLLAGRVAGMSLVVSRLPIEGAITAAQLLNRHGSIERFPPAVLGERHELALLFKELATLRTDAPLFDDVDVLAWSGPGDAFAEWAQRIDAPKLVERSRKLVPAK